MTQLKQHQDEPGEHTTRGLALFWLDNVTSSLMLLSAAYPADVILMGFYLLSSSFVILFSNSTGLEVFQMPKTTPSPVRYLVMLSNKAGKDKPSLTALS
ncbi:MAG: hypothetical protein JST21_13040 [Bacteroidetes bacterium]|nr:hypothetical protein [Bacteroidota bacterium]